MSDEPRVFRKARPMWWPLLLLAAVPLGLAVSVLVFWEAPEGASKGFQDRVAAGKTVALIVPSLFAAGLVVAALFSLSERDDSPRLSVDESGLAIHRSGGGTQRVAWEAVHSMDCEATTSRGTVVKATVHLYVAQGDRLDEVKVNVGGLDAPAQEVFGLMKRLWLQFNYRRGAAVDPGGVEGGP
jgi:hypothetical protein